MNTKIKCCIVVFILTMLPDWIALLSAQNVYSLADRFATAIDFSSKFKQSIINKKLRQRLAGLFPQIAVCLRHTEQTDRWYS